MVESLIYQAFFTFLYMNIFSCISFFDTPDYFFLFVTVFFIPYSLETNFTKQPEKRDRHDKSYTHCRCQFNVF